MFSKCASIATVHLHNLAYDIEALCPLCGTRSCSPSYMGGWGRRFAWGQELEIFPGRSTTVRPYLEWGWGDGAVEKACTVSAGGLKSDSWNTHKLRVIAQVCSSGTGGVETGGFLELSGELV